MKKLTNNLGLKIISVICACILWLIVININDPVVSKQYTGIEVSVKNESVIKSKGQTYDILDDTNIITVTVKAKRSLLSNLRKSDFEAVADMEEIMYDGYVPIFVTCSNPQISSDDLIPSIRNMKISVENMETKQLAVTTSTDGKPADGYAIGKIQVSPNVVRITGPQSVVSQVNKVLVTVDVNRCSSDLDTKIKPELYDENDRLIENSRLSVSEKKISVQVQILDTKNVPLEFEVSDDVKEGYKYTGIEYNPETVLVKGKHSVLSEIESIQIPSSALDISKATKDVEEAIDITQYLPDGVEICDADAANIAVTIHIESLQQKKLSVPVENITVTGLPSGFEVEYLNGNVIEVEIGGILSDISNVSGDQLKGHVDISGYEEGQVALPVTWDLPNGVSQSGSTLLWMNIKRSAVEETEEETDDEEESQSELSKRKSADQIEKIEAESEETDEIQAETENNQEETDDTMTEEEDETKTASEEEDGTSEDDNTE